MRVTFSLNDGESLADSVIQTTGTVEFDDGLRMVYLLEGCWCHCVDCTKPRIKPSHLLGCKTTPGDGVVVIRSLVGPKSNLLDLIYQWY